ncbi:MAG: hypothetical protein K9W44_11620 [Candidatus Lokiarchaeota archaeon]|nr:hypothetical protein [Candidatus Harpocratesius repetitus]
MKAQKTMDISKIKEILKKNLLLVHENTENYTERDAQHIEYIMNLFTKIRKLREEEVLLIFSECEELYLTKNFELALNLIGFAKTIVNQSGLHNWSQKIHILERKIARSLEIVEKYRSYFSIDLKNIPIIQIQQIHNQLDMQFQELEEDQTRQDAIHPEIKNDYKIVFSKITKFMEDHGIPSLNIEDTKNLSMWSSTKKNLDLKSKEIKFKRYYTNAEKILKENTPESIQQGREELLKAYKIVQENPLLFSLSQKQEIIEKLDKINHKISLETEKIPQIFQEINQMCSNFQFEAALKKLKEHKQKLQAMGVTHDDINLDEFQNRIEENRDLYLELHKIEESLEKGDILGAKTKIIPFNQNFSQIRNKIDIFSTLLNRIILVQNSLQSSTADSSKQVEASSTFDPFQDEIPKNEQDLDKQEIFSKKEIFKRLLAEKGQISKNEISKILDIPIDELLHFLMECKSSIDFTVQGPMIYSGDKQFLTNKKIIKSQNSKYSSSKTKETRNRKEKEKEDEDLLDTLEDLLNDD